MAEYALQGLIQAVTKLLAEISTFRDQRSSVFKIAKSGTDSTEIKAVNDALYALDLPDAFTGNNLAVYGKVRADQAIAQAISLWNGGTKTALALSDAAAGETYWFPIPICGLYSIMLVADAQDNAVNIIPRWAQALE